MDYEKVSIYINETERWQEKPLFLELLAMLQKNNVREGIVLRGVAGFPDDARTKTSLFHLHKKLPLIVQFIDHVLVVERVLPELRRMAPWHLMIRKSIEILNL